MSTEPVDAPDHRVAQLLERLTFDYMRDTHGSAYTDDSEELLAEQAHEYATYLANQTEEEVDVEAVEDAVRVVV